MGRSRRIGTASKVSNSRGLSATSRSKRRIVIWFRPPSTSLNRVAPSFRNRARQRISAVPVLDAGVV